MLALFVVFWIFMVLRKANETWVATRVSNDESEFKTINHISYTELYSTKNTMIVYAYLAGWIMKKNVSNSREKMKFIRLYFNRYFKDGYDVSHEMTAALRNETDVDSIVSWLNRKMKDRAKKQQLVEFLIALAMQDRAVTQPEFDAVIWFGKGIGFSQPELEQWIQTKKDQQYRQQESQWATPAYKTVNRKQEALKVLGASEPVSPAELKKIYRNLVKLHHPDTLVNATTAEKEKAEVRFIQIQEAYEYLVNEV